MEELLTIEQTADYLKVSVSTVRRMIKDGRLPARQIGRQWRVPESALDELLAAGVVVEVSKVSEGASAPGGEAVSAAEVRAQLTAKREELRMVEERFSALAFRRVELQREIRALEAQLLVLEQGGGEGGCS